MIDKRRAGIPAQRMGRADEFGAFCAFPCSAQAAYLTGQNILLDGGALTRAPSDQRRRAPSAETTMPAAMSANAAAWYQCGASPSSAAESRPANTGGGWRRRWRPSARPGHAQAPGAVGDQRGGRSPRTAAQRPRPASSGCHRRERRLGGGGERGPGGAEQHLHEQELGPVPGRARGVAQVRRRPRQHPAVAGPQQHGQQHEQIAGHQVHLARSAARLPPRDHQQHAGQRERRAEQLACTLAARGRRAARPAASTAASWRRSASRSGRAGLHREVLQCVVAAHASRPSHAKCFQRDAICAGSRSARQPRAATARAPATSASR